MVFSESCKFDCGVIVLPALTSRGCTAGLALMAGLNRALMGWSGQTAGLVMWPVDMCQGRPPPGGRQRFAGGTREPAQTLSEARPTAEHSEISCQGNNPKMTCESQAQTCRHPGTPSPTTPRFLPSVCLLTPVAPSYDAQEGPSSGSVKNFKPSARACLAWVFFESVQLFSWRAGGRIEKTSRECSRLRSCRTMPGR